MLNSQKNDDNDPLNVKEKPPFHWHMQWSILTIFLSVITIFALITAAYTYYKNYQGLLELSKTRMEIIGHSVGDKINQALSQPLLLAQAVKGVITKADDVSEKNEVLIAYLLNALNIEPYVSRIRIANNEGDMLAVENLILSKQSSNFLNPSKQLPSGIKYALEIINRSGATSKQLWEYKDTNMRTVDKEEISSANYDPKNDLWYSRVAAWPRLYWSSSYSSAGNVEMTVSVPVLDDKGILLAVVSVDVSLDQLSNLISHEKIGISGKAFVFDKNGHLIIPVAQHEPAASHVIPFRLAEMAFDKCSESHQQELMLTEDGTKYLVHCGDFPLSSDIQWLVVIIVPFTDYFGGMIDIQKETALISLGLLLLFAIFVYYASKQISKPIMQLAQAVDRIHQLTFEQVKPVKSHITEIVTLNASFTALSTALRSFSRYIPKQVVRTLVQQGKDIEVGGERREVTIVFSDIENFTTTSEALPIEKLTKALSEYFEAFSTIIVESEGTIDKYIGDSIMSFWNAPSFVVDHADKACIACLRCLDISKDPRQSNLFLKGQTRFGIHTGETIVGNIGTTERLNYTIIGNVVNTAARLQGLNKEYHTSIIISESVHERIGTRFVTRPLDFVVIKGRKKGLTIFELAGVRAAESHLKAEPAQIELCEGFTAAYELFHAGKIEEAKKLFLILQAKFPKDVPIKIYLQRIQDMFGKKETSHG